MTRILLPRPAGTDADADLLERAGIDLVLDPYIEITPMLDQATMESRRRLAGLLPEAALVITSARALASFIDFCEVDRTTRVYAIGPTSARAAAAAGFGDVRMPEDGANNVALTRLLAHERPARLVIPRSSAAPSSLVDDLVSLGIEVHQEAMYSTNTVPDRPASADLLAAGAFDAVIVRSGSAARALHHFLPVWPAGTRVVAAGRPTALVLRELDIPVIAVAAQPDSATVVATTLRALGIGGSHD